MATTSSPSCSLVPNVVNNMLPLLKYAATRLRPALHAGLRPRRPHRGRHARQRRLRRRDQPVTAQINDTQNGSQAIAAAELYLVRQGGPTPGDPGTGTAMAAADGTFNSTVENVTATASTTGLGRGRYVALVRGKDVGNNWGPFSARRSK